MPFRIIRNDITKVSSDAIVNTANPFPVIGRGTDSAIYKAAGVDELLSERKKIGVIKPGNSAYTNSFNLKSNGIKFIIHTVGISYIDGKSGEEEILRTCYSTSLNLAKELDCKSVALPLLGTGFMGFQKKLGFKLRLMKLQSFCFKMKLM